MDESRLHPSGQRRVLIAASASALVVVACIVIATILGELPDVLWFLLVPVGMLGGVLTCLTFLAIALVRRLNQSGLQRP